MQLQIFCKVVFENEPFTIRWLGGGEVLLMLSC